MPYESRNWARLRGKLGRRGPGGATGGKPCAPDSTEHDFKKSAIVLCFWNRRRAALQSDGCPVSPSFAWRGESKSQERKTPLTQDLAGTDAHGQGPASLAQSLAWYALARTGTDASNGQGGRAGGPDSHPRGRRGTNPHLDFEAARPLVDPLSLPKVSHSRNFFSRCHFNLPHSPLDAPG